MSHYPYPPRNPAGDPSAFTGQPRATPSGYGGLRPVSPRQVGRTARQKRASGFRAAFGFLAVIWIVFIVNAVFFGGTLNYLGIHPLDVTSGWHILTSPLLHANIDHISSNSVPGAIFCFLIGYSGRRVFWEVTVIALLIGGLGVWLFGGVGTNHIGASGLIYGWLAYLVVRGVFNRSGRQILLGIVLGFFYSGLIWGVLPGTPGVSWQAHLFGAIGGILAGMLITSDDPPKLAARRVRRDAYRRASLGG